MDTCKIIKAANELANKYDLGIGVAKGGLWSTHMFYLFNLPVKIVDAHKKHKGTSFEWHDKPEGLEGRKIIVFDDDVRTGRTAQRVLDEIQKYCPEKTDLLLNIDAVPQGCKRGTILNAIPKGYGEFFFLNELNTKNCYEGILKLKEKLI